MRSVPPIPRLAGLVLLLCVMFAGTASAQLPADDSARYHLVTVTEPRPTPAGSAMLQSIDQHPDLARIAAACKRFAFDTANPVYQSRYAGTLPPNQTPIVALVRSDGGVIYKASGANLPTGDGLAAALIAAASADQKANPPAMQSYTAGDCPTCPNQRPRLPLDGSRLPAINPIPDSVTIAPNFSLPDSAIYAAGGVLGLVLLLACGFGAVLLIIAGLVLLLK